MYSVDAGADDNVLTVRCDVDGADHSKFNFLLMSDVHWDSPHCDRRLLKRILDEAKDAGMGIMSIGDWFDAMQGRDDRRHQKGDLRPELGADDYLDKIVDLSAEFLEPYKDNIIFLGDGNHETSVLKKMETDLTGRLARRLGVTRMGYSGFVRFMFKRVQTGGATGGRVSKNMYFHHGSGGGGPVTKGVIRTNRMAVYLPDADLVVGGHVHEEWQVTQSRMRLRSSGRIDYDEQLHVCLPTFKQEMDPFGGFHTERGRPPKPVGAAWLSMRYMYRKPKADVMIEVRRAK